MRYERNSEVVYRNGLVAGVYLGIWCVFLIAAIAVAIRGRGGIAPFIGLGLTVLPLFTYVQAIRPRVVLRRTEVQVYGYVLGSETVPYVGIEDVGFTGRFAGKRWLQIERDDGWVVGVHPFMASVGMYFDPLWQRPLADELSDRSSRASSPASNH